MPLLLILVVLLLLFGGGGYYMGPGLGYYGGGGLSLPRPAVGNSFPAFWERSGAALGNNQTGF
jgi:hypothetical protein